MAGRKPVFPGVIEVNYQVGHVIGCNVYLVFDEAEWVLIDIGYEETVDEIIELIRQLDFPFSKCKALIATHADVDHIQGLAKAKHILRAPVYSHPVAAPALESGDVVHTFAEIPSHGISMPMPPVKVDHLINEGDVITVGGRKLDVWLTPGHTNSQLSFRMGDILFSGDNIYRDGCVGVIDAHHGSDIASFLSSLKRIRECDAKWLLPSHGPIFKKDNRLIDKTIARLEMYLHMADFGPCAADWPLLEEWEAEIEAGKFPS
jgi:hydroxyacylglutathione hydrolase